MKITKDRVEKLKKGMERFDLLVATMFFSGLLRGPGGTYGSAVAWALMLPVYQFNTPAMRIVWSIAVVLATFGWGCVSIPGAIGQLQQKRPTDKKASSGDFNSINIDEAHGVAISLLPVFVVQPEHWILWSIASVLIFRFFDIRKPLGIRTFERKSSAKSEDLNWKALIIMVDDSIAGAYSMTSISLLMTASWHFLRVL